MRLLLAVLALPAAAGAQDARDQSEIRQLMRSTWERPGAPLSIEPVVVYSGYAIAGWIQDDRGGRALLRRRHDAWEVILCSGDQLRSAGTLRQAGIGPPVAERLVALLLDAEGRMPPQRLTKLSLFDGIVRMDQGNSHHSHQAETK